MKVRDIRQYIRAISKGNETLELVGSNQEYFLNMMSGQGQKVEALITSAASFANNAKEQLFYEFVQNAYDANADTLLFYANKDFLIVLNNGKPFYTDLDIFNLPKGEEARDGQLYNFLAKGKSLKLNDNEKLGKYGQGSKLLYTLLADINHNVNTEDLLKDAIINKKKGPYLVSWHNMSQLDAWLINDNEWIPSQADDIENNILFAKILMSYYPIAPSQDPDRFSNEEAQNAIQAFSELVDPPRNKSFLTRGTALIIPLGKGKYEAIVEENNITNVRARLGSFASITADQERNEGKTLKHIYVMGKEVEQHSARSLFIDFEECGNKFHYHFAFNPIFAEKNVVNFFKGLPILQTKYRFGFILDSQILEVDDSRQRISDTEKTCDQLRLAYTHLVEELKSLLETNREKFDYIYQSLIASHPEDNSEDEQKIRKAFYDIIRPFLNEHAYTSEGTYVPFEQVCEEEKETNILLKDIGITDLHWIDNKSRKKYSFHFDKKIRALRFAEMLHMADKEKLTAWIKGMSNDDYRLFQNNCLDCITEIEEMPVFRSNENNLYSLKELKSNINVYYLSQDTEQIFIGQEYIVEPVCVEYNSDDYLNIFNKIKANLEELRKTSFGKDAICQILCMIAEKDSDYEDEIIKKIKVLQNWCGDYLPFSELFEERLDGSVLFDNFCVKGSIPECIKQRNWLINKHNTTAIWNWIIKHFDDIKKEDGWGTDTDAYLRDIQNVYKAVDISISGSLLSLYLDENGKPIDEPCLKVENFEKLSETEYEKLQNTYSDYNFVPYKYEKVLSSAPFMINTLYVNDLINPNQYLDFDTIAILSKISSDGFLLKHRIIGDEKSFKVQLLNGGKNYTNNLGTELRRALLEIGFYYIPPKIQTLITSGTNAFNITRDDFAKSVVDKISDKSLIFPLIKDCSASVVEYYINSLSTISIDHKVSESNIYWQIIKFAVSRDNDENKFKQTIFNRIKHKNKELPKTIKDSCLIAYNHEYSLYALNSDYQKENEDIDSFLDCLPSPNDAEWFKEQFYGDKKEVVSCKEIYDEIKDTYLSIEQLRFCIDYSLNEDPDYNNLEIDDNESLSEALSMIKSNQYIGFDKYFKISGFKPESQVFAEQSLLNEDEKLPNEMQKWLELNIDAISLFDNIRTETESYISVRRCIRDNEEAITINDFEDSYKTESTINWLLNAELTYVYDDNAYKNIKRVIDILPEGINHMVFLRYTGNVEYRDKSLDHIRPTFTLEEYDKESCFLSTFAWTPIFLDMLKNEKKVKNYFVSEKVFAYEELELLSKHKLHKAPKLEVFVKAREGDYKEIVSEPYLIWKTMPESRGFLIKTSKKPIGINFTMLKNREQVFSKAIENKDFGYDTNGLVVVQYPNPEKLSAIKMIEKHIADMGFFQQPFIVLQGLYVDQLERLEQIAEKKGTDITTIVKTSDTSHNGNNVENDTNLKIDEDKLESAKELVDSFDADELMEIADKKDMVLEILYEVKYAEDETKESQVRQIIGYIGELIYEQYLLAQGKKYKYAAIEGVGDYDFRNFTDNSYIDVKTTLYSLKDGSAPFYLHRSQNMFMQKHPNAKYHIIRISLNDLNLQKSYERIRDIYGKEANPMDDERLKEDCLKVAKKYWKGATIEQFDALSLEYSIKIEKK